MTFCSTLKGCASHRCHCAKSNAMYKCGVWMVCGSNKKKETRGKTGNGWKGLERVGQGGKKDEKGVEKERVKGEKCEKNWKKR